MSNIMKNYLSNHRRTISVCLTIIAGVLFFAPLLELDVFFIFAKTTWNDILKLALRYQFSSGIIALMIIPYIIPVAAFVSAVFYFLKKGKYIYASLIIFFIITTTILLIIVATVMWVIWNNDLGKLSLVLTDIISWWYWCLLFTAIGGLIFTALNKNKITSNTLIEKQISNSQWTNIVAHQAKSKKLEVRAEEYTVFMTLGILKGAKIPIPNKGLIVGSDAKVSHIVIMDQHIKRVHCVFSVDEKTKKLILMSCIGAQTWLNGKELVNGNYYTIDYGDNIYLGDKSQIFKVMVNN